MKRGAIFGVFVLAVSLAASFAQAAVITVDVTIKAVNPQARGITVVYKTDMGEKTIELDVSRKAEITVNEQDGTLDSLGPGLKGKVTFDKDLAVVTKIEAKGRPAVAKAPELVEVAELNGEGSNDHPWLSDDGLTIYWDRSTGQKASIWTAHREKPESTFDNAKSLFSGKCPTVSSDGLAMILVGDRAEGAGGMSLQLATRESVAQRFGRPKEIPELSSHDAWAPSLSADGLTLHFTVNMPRNKSMGFYSTRKDESSPWSKAKNFAELEFDSGSVMLSFVTADGLTMLGQQIRQKSVLVICSRTSKQEPFGEPKLIEFNKHPLSGAWARYVSTTHELVFVSKGPLKEGPANKGAPMSIWAVKNFVLPDGSR